MAKEHFEQRLFRVFAQAGYTPAHILTITPEEMVEVPGVTIPEVRTILCVQNKVLAEQNNVRRGQLIAAFLQEAHDGQ